MRKSDPRTRRMSNPTSSNFAFLGIARPELSEYGTLAESYVHRDPNAALLKLRLFGERMLNGVVDRARVDTADVEGQHDLINLLRKAGRLTVRESAILHQLRREGNRAAHEGLNDRGVAEACLTAAHEVAVTLGERYFGARHTVPFSMPVPEAQAPDDRASEVEALLTRLEGIEADLLETRFHATMAVERRDELERHVKLMRQQLADREVRLRQQADQVSALAAAAQELEAQRRRVAELEAEVGRKVPMPESPAASSAPTPSHHEAPSCPQCKSPMVRRVARQGPSAGKPFWGCKRYPDCRGTINIQDGQLRDREDERPNAEVPAGDSTATTGGRFRWRAAEWRSAATHPRWRMECLRIGGRLRGWDPLANQDPALVAASSHTVLYQYVPPVLEDIERMPADILVAGIGRRLAIRGARPPIDLQLELVLWERLGLTDALIPPASAHDLAPLLGPDGERAGLDEIRHALLHRARFELDPDFRLPDGKPLVHPQGEMTLLTRVLPAALGGAIGHWITPQASLDGLLPPSKAPGDRRVDFLVLHPGMVQPVAVEVDGEQHHAAAAVDAQRDQLLADVGIVTIRGSAEALARDAGARLGEEGVRAVEESPEPTVRMQLFAWGPAIAHRLLYMMANALELGLLRQQRPVIALDEPTGLGAPYVRSAIELLDAIAGAHGQDVLPSELVVRDGRGSTMLRRETRGCYVAERADDEGEAVVCRFTIECHVSAFHRLPPASDRIPHFLSRPTLLPIEPYSGRAAHPPAWPTADTEVADAGALERLLQGIFAKVAFQPDGEHPRGQEVAIRRMLAGRDTVVLLPTGAGKSLIYQLGALLQPGLALVVDPLVSLIDDQLDGLARQGIDRAIGITSADSRERTVDDKLALLRSGEAFFAFIAPERLQNRRFREAMRELSTSVPVSVVVVDEAHCVSEWGHDFRTAYLDLGRVLRDVCQDGAGRVPPLLALTGTASRSVLRDLLVELSIDRSDPDTIIVPASFDRPELSFEVIRCDSDDMMIRLLGGLAALPRQLSSAPGGESIGTFLRLNKDRTNCGVVFCRTVKRSLGVVSVAEHLRERLRVEVLEYHGKMPDDQKRRNAGAFKKNEAPVLVATQAYGMGIDKPNIRFIVHVGVPASIEGYYQEAGRAGRDRKRSRCVIVSSDRDRDIIDFFHQQNYRGAEQDLAHIATVLRELRSADAKRKGSIPMETPSSGREERERAVHRLKLLGVVSDYTVDHGGKQFSCKLPALTIDTTDTALLAFVRRSQPGRVPSLQADLARETALTVEERVLANARRLLHFIYGTIAASRQRAAGEMLALTTTAKTDADVRDRILRYLSLSDIADRIERMCEGEVFEPMLWMSEYDAIDTGEDARDWRGATGRLLVSLPDHPGLLLGRGLVEAVVSGGRLEAFRRDVMMGLSKAADPYRVDESTRAALALRLLEWLRLRRADWVPLLHRIIAAHFATDTPAVLHEMERAVLTGWVPADIQERESVLDIRLVRHRHLLNELATRLP
jgi:ATP-dependent DNA helicase RecQ